MRRLLVATVVVELDEKDVDAWVDATELRVTTVRALDMKAQAFVHHFHGWTMSEETTSERIPAAGDVVVHGGEGEGRYSFGRNQRIVTKVLSAGLDTWQQAKLLTELGL